ncbi:MAG: FAD-dependent oxidoreductase [Rhodobacteraceae bacterium PARR1]|nr:MAG: FAD-dependent oxidoreductase [Rhodobacteraceae bacterium PARR1]
MDHFDSIVIGAGVVGLAIARALSRAGGSVLIVERGDRIGGETSSRNSEVIHAGLYYPAGSLKARLCVEGRDQLYTHLARRALPHRRCGKLIVATDPAQHLALHQVARAAAANGVALTMLSAAEAMALEPALHCTAALLSPQTGIFDSQAYMHSLLAEAEDGGATLALRTEAETAEVTPHGFRLTLRDRPSEERLPLSCTRLVNAAGHGAPGFAKALQGGPSAPQARMAKGSYFHLPGRAAFSRLIYPVPEPGGLGIHLTLDLHGAMRFGPDVEWLAPQDAPDLRVDPARRDRFAAAIARYWPGLPADALTPAFAGLRPKISGPDDPAADFRIDLPADHGIPGLAQLYGIESPGLTASLALAGHVVAGLA